VSVEGDARAKKGEKAEKRGKEFEKWRESEPGGTTGEQLGLLKGSEWSVCMGAGSDGLDEDIGDGTTAPDASEPEEHPPLRPNQLPEEHASVLLNPLLDEQRADEEPEEEAQARQDEKAENRRKEFEKWREWKLGEATRDWSGWSVRLGVESEGLDEGMGDSAADPNATESEEHPPTRPNLLLDEDLTQRGLT
jgi:hypothetical protein